VKILKKWLAKIEKSDFYLLLLVKFDEATRNTLKELMVLK
jgi:hypothetical protein